jgi:hypothetical protein
MLRTSTKLRTPLKPSAMYIKLRYRARLAQPAQVYELIPEVEDICRSHGWPYRVWDEDWRQPAKVSGEFADGALHFEGHAPLKGVTFQIGDSETVWLTFQADGVLQSLMTLTEPTFTADDADSPWQRVKTGGMGARRTWLSASSSVTWPTSTAPPSTSWTNRATGTRGGMTRISWLGWRLSSWPRSSWMRNSPPYPPTTRYPKKNTAQRCTA